MTTQAADRDEEAQHLRRQYQLLDALLVWCKAAMSHIDAHSKEGDLIAAGILTTSLRVLSTNIIDTTHMKLGAVLFVCRVRQIIYDTRSVLYAHSPQDSGSSEPILTQAARIALSRLQSIDPLTGNTAPPDIDVLVTMQTVIDNSTWPLIST